MPGKRIGSNFQPFETRQDIIAEILKCAKSPIHFIDNYAKIQHPTRGLVPFKTFTYQHDAIEAFINHRFNIILKARQLGFTTIVAAFIAWFITFHKDRSVLIVSTKAEVAKNTIRVIRTILSHVPKQLMLAKITIDNRQSIELNNDSRVKAITTSADAGRSEAPSLLFIDEAAHIEKMDELWTGLLPSVSAGGRIIASSTPNGTANWFYRTYKAAHSYQGNFNCRYGLYTNPDDANEQFNDRFLWWVHPEHGQKWFDEQTSDSSLTEIAQEHLCVSQFTKILTIDGFRYAKDICVGDLVKTHKGRFRPVTQTNARVLREGEKVYDVSVPLVRQHEIKITGNHPLWTARVGKSHGQSSFANLKGNDFDLKFIPIEERKIPLNRYLNVLNVPLSQNLLSNHLKKFDLADLCQDFVTEHSNESVRYFRAKTNTKRIVDVDYELGKIVGYYLAEGYLSDSYGVSFAFHLNETHHHRDIRNFANRYNMRYRETKRLPEAGNACICIINNKFLIYILNQFIEGKYCYEKRLTKKIWETNKDFIRGIIEGIWFGDGLHNPVYKNKLALVNERLIYQIRDLMTMFNLFPRTGELMVNGDAKIYFLELSNVQNQKIDFLLNKGQNFLEISGKKNSCGSRTRFHDNKLWGRIQYSEDIDFDGFVYNIEVEEDNTYICDNLIVHNCSFNASGETYLPATTIQEMASRCREPVERAYDDRNLWIWEHPTRYGQYIIACDVSSGYAKDFSAFHVIQINCDPVVQVAEYKGKIAPDILGELLLAVGKKYNNATLAPENNSGWSGQTIQKIQEAKYQNLYWMSRKNNVVDIYSAGSTHMTIPGYGITSANRIQMLSKMEQYIRKVDIVTYSSRLVDEFREFIWFNSKPQAARLANDDLIMSLAGAIWIRDESFALGYKHADMTKALLDASCVQSKQIKDYDGFNISEENKSRRQIPNITMSDGTEMPLTSLIFK